MDTDPGIRSAKFNPIAGDSFGNNVRYFFNVSNGSCFGSRSAVSGLIFAKMHLQEKNNFIHDKSFFSRKIQNKNKHHLKQGFKLRKVTVSPMRTHFQLSSS